MSEVSNTRALEFPSETNNSSDADRTDWFGDFVIDDAWTLNFQEHEKYSLDKSEEPDSLSENCSGKNMLYKRGLPLDVSKLIQVIYQASNPSKIQQINFFIQYFILFVYGKRNIRKDAIDESKLSLSQKEVYNRIREEMKNPLRRQRILNFINQKDITKRLINYFVVHYSLVEREISYYLDCRTYPYKIIGEFNNPDQKDILKLQESGANIVWINLHREYKNSKNKKGRRNRHAPYCRGVVIKGSDGFEYSLCELNFYLWLDDVGGFELFYMFENDIRDKKAKYDEEKRQQESQIVFGKKKKRKIVLRNTDGKNYKTHVLNQKTMAPFSIMADTSCTYEEYIRSLQSLKRAPKTLDPAPSNKRFKFKK
jgi:hypothetical protein